MSQTPDFVLGDDFARVLTETTMSLVCVLGEDGRILFFNEACERLTGFLGTGLTIALIAVLALSTLQLTRMRRRATRRQHLIPELRVRTRRGEAG